MGARTTAPRRPLISLIPAAHIAVVPSYPVLLVCMSICDRIVSIFHLSFNIHSKNTNKLVLRDNMVFHILVSLLHGSVPRRNGASTRGQRIYHEFLDRVVFPADVGLTRPVVSLLLDPTFTGFSSGRATKFATEGTPSTNELTLPGRSTVARLSYRVVPWTKVMGVKLYNLSSNNIQCRRPSVNQNAIVLDLSGHGYFSQSAACH
ncbi:hypothetical protein EDB84DRAFT_839309 [Lactarius hengduanensis]|nr:hypothetical protein EDB84DRAFT_839309 [Lactarius hengduanensis]